MSSRAINQFTHRVRNSTKISENCYALTTEARQDLVVPEGVRIYDTDLDTVFYGDGTTEGGVSKDANRGIRFVNVDAASSTPQAVATASGSTSNTNTISWASASGIRTGDAVVITGGTGTVPSGITASGVYYIQKTDDVGDGASNTGTRFKVASTRANALAGTTVTLHSSGVAGYTTVYNTVVAQKNDGILRIDPAGAAISVALPDADTSKSFSVIICKDNGANAVLIKELDASGNVASSGNVTIDSTTGWAKLPASAAYAVTLHADDVNGEYFTSVGSANTSGTLLGQSS